LLIGELKQVQSSVEFVQHRLLHALDLAIEMRLARLDRAPLDLALSQRILKLVAGELSAAVSLDVLDRKRHRLQEVFQEADGIGGRPSWIDLGDKKTGTVVNGCILNPPRSYLAGVNLHSLARYLLLVAFELAPPPFALQAVDAQPLQSLVDGGCGEMEPVVSL
jgi:hypothetical protein